MFNLIQEVGWALFLNYPDYDKYKETESLASVVNASEFIFICLPTPMKEDESGIDLSIIEEMVSEITRYTDGTGKIIFMQAACPIF